MTRFVLRPHGIRTTPRLLAEALSARGTRRWPSYMKNDQSYLPSFTQDFFLTYPDPIYITEGREATNANFELLKKYRPLRRFASTTKPEQRRLLSLAMVPCPKYAVTLRDASVVFSGDGHGKKYIVRPLRHSQGKDYRLTSDWNDFSEGREYISELFKKNYEYRVIFCLGSPLITLIKKIPNGLSYEEPWNHANGSRFVTVENYDNNRLRKTDAIERLSNFEVIQTAHLVAADILLSGSTEYVITELNFCPALTIPNNLEKVAQHVSSHR